MSYHCNFSPFDYQTKALDFLVFSFAFLPVFEVLVSSRDAFVFFSFPFREVRGLTRFPPMNTALTFDFLQMFLLPSLPLEDEIPPVQILH